MASSTPPSDGWTAEDLAIQPDTIATKVVDDRVIFLRRLMFGSVQLGYSTPEDLAIGVVSEEWQFNPGYMEDVYFAPDQTRNAYTLAAAHFAFLEWDGQGEPEGWTRHVPTGRRRYNGDPDRELVRP